MKKVHYDKFGDGGICCGTRFAEYITDKQEEVTCEKCKDVMGFRFEDVPIWVGTFIGALLARGLNRLFGGSSHQEEETRVDSTPRSFLEDAEHRFCGGRCERCGCSESAVAHFGWPCR